MSPEDIPEDREQSYLCEKCKSGNVSLQENQKWWECDECDFAAENVTK